MRAEVEVRFWSFVILSVAACGGQDDGSRPPYVARAPYASVVFPPTETSDVILLDDGTACVIDTYWTRIECREPSGAAFRFGREGEGPGEFRRPNDIIRGPDGTIGVLDGRLLRMSFFSRRGEFLTSVPGIPQGFRTRNPSVAGGLTGAAAGGRMTVELDVATGRTLWERQFPVEDDVTACSTPRYGTSRRRLIGGYNDRIGGLIFVTCYGEFLVRYADRTAPEPSGIVRSTYVERYATEEDVAAELGVLDARRSGGFRPNVNAEDIRAEPRVWYGARLVDDRSRFWAVSHWNWADEILYDESYIDMYRLTDDGLTFGVTLQVADKALALDVLGDRLAVFVMRDTGGVVPEYRVDWYNVSEYE